MSSQREPGDWQSEHFAVPDDAAELDADRWQYYAELSRRGAIEHAPGRSSQETPGGWRDGLPWFGFRGSRHTPVLFMVAAALAMLASLLLLGLMPRANPPEATQPLSLTSAAVGEVGGLLPASQAAVNGSPRVLRDIRPALLVLVPGACGDCADTVAAAAGQARAEGVRPFVTGIPAQSATLTWLATAVAAPVLTTEPGAFDDFAPAGVTLIAVGADGEVSQVVRDATADTDVSASLRQVGTPAEATR